MATKVMHRILSLTTGEISVSDWVYDGYVSLNEIHIDYDNQLKPEHAQMVADAAKWKSVVRFSAGFSDWMGVFGSVGDGS